MHVHMHGAMSACKHYICTDLIDVFDAIPQADDSSTNANTAKVLIINT